MNSSVSVLSLSLFSVLSFLRGGRVLYDVLLEDSWRIKTHFFLSLSLSLGPSLSLLAESLSLSSFFSIRFFHRNSSVCDVVFLRTSTFFRTFFEIFFGSLLSIAVKLTTHTHTHTHTLFLGRRRRRRRQTERGRRRRTSCSSFVFVSLG